MLPPTWWAKCVAGGLIAGGVMGLYEMIASLATGAGLWLPINLIGATLPAFRPPSPEFAGAATLCGIALHAATSVAWGLVYGVLAAFLFPGEAVRPGPVFLIGMLFGTGVWVFMGLGLGPWIDPFVRMADPVVFAAGHLVYGIVLALVVALWAREGELRPAAVTFAPGEAERVQERGKRR